MKNIFDSNRISIVLVILNFFFVGNTFTQCSINASATSYEITCGESVDLSAFGSSTGQVILDEDFNSGGFGTGWSGTPGSTNFSNPCSPAGVDGTPHAWMDNNTTVPRTLTSSAYDLSGATAGVTICFDLLFAVQGGASPCEGPDEPDEGVFLQYSIDGGATWVDIHYFDPNGGNDPLLTNWNNWCFTIPAAAITGNTLFRWHQTADSGADYDHWGIDNVQIFQNDINAEVTWLHDGYSYGVGNAGGVNPNPVTPTATTTYTAQIVTGTGDVCTADVTIVVLAPNYDITVSATPTTICSGDCSTITGTGQIVVDPGGITTYENNETDLITGTPGFPGIPPFVPPTPGSIEADMNINVVGINQPTVTSGLITTVCINDFSILPLGGGSVSLADIEIVLTCPGGTQITLVNVGDMTGTTITNMCFQVGGPAVSGGSAPYTGTFNPAEPFDNLIGCDADGVWNLTISGAINDFSIPFGSIGGWSITFDNPPVYQTVDYSWGPTTGLSNPNDINTDACPTVTTTYDLVASNGVAGCPTHTESITIIVDPCGGCVPPIMVINVPASICLPSTFDLATSIDGTSQPATITYHASSADATADVNPISATVAASGTYFIRSEDPTDPTCFTVDQVVVSIISCCDLDVSTTVVAETCDGADDGAINFTVNGSATYDIIIDGTTEFNNVGAGAQNWTGQADGTYAVQIVDIADATCDTTFNVTINQGVVVTIDTENATDITNCIAPDGTFTVTAAGATSFELFTSAGVSVTTNATGSFTGLNAGDYYVVVSIGTCTAQTSTLTIANASAPAAPNAGTDATYCVGDAMIDLTVSGTGGTFTWYSDAGLTTSIGTGGTLTPGSTLGSTIYYVTETVTGCESPASTVTITINVCCDLTVSTVVTDETCDGANDGIIDFTIGGTGTYDVIVGGTTEFNDVTAGSFNLPAQADGVYAIQVVDITDPACDTTFNVTINPGVLVTITSESSTDIANCLSPDGTYSVVSNGTSFELFTAAGSSVATNATGNFTGLNAGDYYVVASIGACTAQSATLTISNASAPPAPTAGTDATYCMGDLLTDLTATAGSGGTLNWYSDGGLTTNIGTGGTLSPTNTAGVSIYYVTETVTGCESPATAVTITINAIPSAPTAGTDATYCMGDVLLDMTATVSSGGILNWYSDAGLTTNIGTGSSLAPNNTLGATSYFVTETVGACQSLASTVTITINPNPTITGETSTDVADCLNPDGTITITASGTSYELFNATTGLTTGQTNATGLFTGLDVGDYYVVITLNGCTLQSATVTINNASAPPAPIAGTDAAYCNGVALTDLSATAGSGGSINWYSDAGLTTNIGTNSTITPNNTIGTTIYYVTETVSNCESPASMVTITINAVPSAPTAGTDAIYCQGDAMAGLTAIASIGGTLNWYSDAGATANIGNGTGLTPGTTLGATSYYVTETSNGCESAPSLVTITINANPIITAEVATDLTSCVTPNGTITITANGMSYELFTLAGVSIMTNATGAFTGLGAGSYYVEVSNGTCSTTGATLAIIDQTSTSSSTVNNSVCSGDSYTFADGSSSVITANETRVSTLTNNVGCDSVVTENVTVLQPVTVVVDTTICEGTNYTSVGDAASFTNVLNDFTHTSVLVGSNGCDSTIIENVTITPTADIDLGFDVSTCFGETITITATSTAGVPIWSTGDTTMSITYDATVDTFFIAAVSGICGVATDTIFINVLPLPDITASADVTIPLGATTQLGVTSTSSPITYVWDPSTYLDCDDCEDPISGPLNSIVYVVTGTDENGCSNSDIVVITIDGEIEIYIPNIFSPNNDGENDLFRVYGAVWKHYKMQIYNRWGGLVWESEDPNVEWDGNKQKNGEPVPQAVFVYKFWGVTNIGLTFEKFGNVMLTR